MCRPYFEHERFIRDLAREYPDIVELFVDM
jgi:hypothetical protein